MLARARAPGWSDVRVLRAPHTIIITPYSITRRSEHFFFWGGEGYNHKISIRLILNFIILDAKHLFKRPFPHANLTSIRHSQTWSAFDFIGSATSPFTLMPVCWSVCHVFSQRAGKLHFHAPLGTLVYAREERRRRMGAGAAPPSATTTTSLPPKRSRL